MKSIQTEPCVSSNIAELGYDEESETLRVVFVSGSVYDYDGVPLQEYENLRDAASVGGYFSQNIRNSYDGRRV
jgi:hypothetical protein